MREIRGHPTQSLGARAELQSVLFLVGFIFFPIKSLGELPQEVAPCFQSHFLIPSSEFPVIGLSLGLLVVHLA